MSRQTRIKIVYNKMDEIANKMPGAVNEIVAETLAEIDATVQLGMAAGGGGRVYIRRGRTHTASKPGEMPARDLGALSGSLQVELQPSQYKGYYYTVSEYGMFLEYGTSKMAPRPFMTPAAAKAKPGFMRKLKNLEKHLK